MWYLMTSNMFYPLTPFFNGLLFLIIFDSRKLLGRNKFKCAKNLSIAILKIFLILIFPRVAKKPEIGNRNFIGAANGLRFCY